MKFLIFPLTVGAAMVLGPIAAVYIDMDVLGHTDTKFNGWHMFTIVAAFSGICALPTMLAAGMARVLLRRRYPYTRPRHEIIAAAMSGAIIVLAICVIINWEIEIGGLAGLIFGLPVAGFLISSTALAVMTRFLTKSKPHGESVP